MNDTATAELDETAQALLRRAIELAAAARDSGNSPFGSLLADAAGNVLAERQNTALTERDLSAHPELRLAVWAAQNLTPQQRRDATMYTSTENCAMCSGAFVSAGLGRLVFAVGSADLRRYRGDRQPQPFLDLSSREVFERASYPIDVTGPALLDEGLAVHHGFWT
jgi:tRNA(Arg) A34 adenosine deaminase TadA